MSSKSTKILGQPTRRKRRQARTRRAWWMPLSLEMLENRRLLSVTFQPSPAATPTITGADRGGVIPTTGNSGNEPSLVVDPNNPANLAIAAGNRIAYSGNDGGSFSAAQFFPLPAGYTGNGGDTWISYDGQDQLFQTNLAIQGGPAALAVAKINTSGGNSTSTVVDQAPGGVGDDRQVMAADSNPSSPYRDNLYVIWSENGSGGPMRVSRSTDSGTTWTNTQTISSETSAWQPSITVGPNGYVYAAYHAQPGYNTYTDSTGATQTASEPNGTSGEVFVAVSKDGGQTYTFPTDSNGNKLPVFGAGQADITWNIQAYASNQAAQRTLPGERFLTAGSSSPVVVAGPAGRVYSIVADDPTNGGTSGNLADLRIATSTDYGKTWGASQLLEGGPGSSTQLFPAAAADKFGDLVVTWYDNRNGAKNSSGDYLLDVFAKYSTDGGTTWSSAFQVNAPNDPLDPLNGAPVLGNGFPSPPNTYRIGEYISTAIYGGTAYVAWTGNNGGSQQILWKSFPIAGSLTVNEDSSLGNSIVISAVPGSPGFVQVSVNQQVEYAGLASALTGITINEGAAADTVNIANAFFIPIQVNMGSGRDTVNIGTDGISGGSVRGAIQGDVNITRGSGHDTLNVDDENSQGELGGTWTLTGSGLSLNELDGGAVSYNGIDAVALAGGSGVTYDVEGTSAPTIVNVAAGFSSVNVSAQAKNLDNLPAMLTVNGSGTTALVVNDQNNPNVYIPIQDTITGTTLTRTGLSFNGINVVAHSASITYSGLGNLTLDTGALPNVVFVESTSAPTTVNAGAGNSVVFVSDQSENLDNIPAALTVNGNGADALIVNDRNNPNSYVPTEDTITSTSLARIAFGTSFSQGIPGPHDALINYSGLGSLELDAGARPNIIHAESTSAPTTVSAGAGNTLVDVSAQAENLDNVPAGLTVNGNGTDALVVNDQNNSNFFQPTEDTITSAAITRVAFALVGFDIHGGPIFVPRSASITYGGLGSVEFDTGAFANAVYVESTAVPTTINAGAGNFLVDVTDQSENLDNLPAALTVHGAGATALVVNDQNNPNYYVPTQDTITGTSLTRIAFGLTFINGIPFTVPRVASIAYSGLGSLELDTGALPNLIFVEGTAVPTTISAGAGNFLVDVSDQTENLDSLQGALTVNGTSSLIINDQLKSTAETYNVAAATIGRTGAALISYANVGNLALYGGGASDTFTVGSPLSATAVSIDGGGGTNTLAGPNTTNAWNMTGPNSGTLGAVAFAKFQNLVGGTASDRFAFQVAGGVSGNLDGGPGFDTLDYSAAGLTGLEPLDLAHGIAPRIAGLVTNVENVFPASAAAPVAKDDVYSASNMVTKNVVAAAGVLANDADAGGNPLSAVLDSATSHGTLTLNADGSFSYVPVSGFVGDDSFVYHANGGGLNSAEATVTIHVYAPAQVVQVAVNSDATQSQRSQILNLEVTFNELVDLGSAPASAFQLLGPDGQQVNLSAVITTNSLGDTAVTLTFMGPDTYRLFNGEYALVDGRYQLTVLKNGVNDGHQRPMDADAVDKFFRLFGDARGTGLVDNGDLTMFKKAYNTVAASANYRWYLDEDMDGRINALDLSAFQADYYKTLSP